MEKTDKLERAIREIQAKQTAQREKRSISYTDKDGCEVTVTPTGHVFYNAADWW